MGCGCKKPKNVEVVVTPTPTPVPQTPDELHAQQITEWNGGVQPTTKDGHND
jgi:hypothetical protein